MAVMIYSWRPRVVGPRVAAPGRSASAIPDLEPIHPGVSDLNRETPFGNSARILSVIVAHLYWAQCG
jgi:hypothetical protein